MFRRFILLGLLAVSGLSAESGLDAWLRYAPLEEAAARQYRENLPALVVCTVPRQRDSMYAGTDSNRQTAQSNRF